MFDVTIIGGGPAGSAAAIRLARRGMQVRLYEKTVFPRPKLCGGFLSPESLEDLEDLGVLDALNRSGIPTIRRSVIVSRDSTRVECALPSESLSVSRDQFDALLLDQASREGVDVRMGEDGFSQPNHSDWTVIAAGRWHRSSRAMEPQGLSPWYIGPHARYVGLQAIFQNVRGVSDQVELDIVESGYVGLARQRDGVNVCALTTEAGMQQAGTPDRAMARFTAENPALGSHLQDARRDSSWMTVGPVRLGIRQLTGPNTFYVGDAACVMDPFAGEGMAMGLYGSRILVKALEQSRAPATQAYERLWHKAFDPALRWNAVMRLFYSLPLLREPILRGLRWFPQGMNWLTDLTRYRRIEHYESI